MAIAAGVDVGNRSTKVVVLNDKKEIIGSSLIMSLDEGKVMAEKAMEEAIKKAGIIREEIDYIISTGDGKNEVSWANENATDFSCHSATAYHYFPTARNVIDLGAENCRISRLDAKGRIEKFALNDKCASGTGGFLETVADMMEMGVSNIGSFSLQFTREITLNAMCAVFAESEIVTEIHRATPKADILWGVNIAVALKVSSYVNRIGLIPDVVMTGGVAQNPGILESLKKKLSIDIVVPPDPQMAGAFGAALLALEKRGNEK